MTNYNDKNNTWEGSTEPIPNTETTPADTNNYTTNTTNQKGKNPKHKKLITTISIILALALCGVGVAFAVSGGGVSGSVVSSDSTPVSSVPDEKSKLKVGVRFDVEGVERLVSPVTVMKLTVSDVKSSKKVSTVEVKDLTKGTELELVDGDYRLAVVGPVMEDGSTVAVVSPDALKFTVKDGKLVGSDVAKDSTVTIKLKFKGVDELSKEELAVVADELNTAGKTEAVANVNTKMETAISNPNSSIVTGSDAAKAPAADNGSASGGGSSSGGGSTDSGGSTGGGSTPAPAPSPTPTPTPDPKPVDPNAGKTWHEAQYKTVNHPAEYGQVWVPNVVTWPKMETHYGYVCQGPCRYRTEDYNTIERHCMEVCGFSFSGTDWEVQVGMNSEDRGWYESRVTKDAWSEQVLVREAGWY